MKTYCHDSLDFEDEIRILHIRKAGLPYAKTLRFTLERVRLSEDQKYEALSYVWGSKERPKTIKDVDTDEILYVTRKCFLALSDLCYDGERRLFVDQVCINQDDIDERNQQVALMARIYKQAFRTIIYLGPMDSHSKFVLRVRNSGRHGQHHGTWFLLSRDDYVEQHDFAKYLSLMRKEIIDDNKLEIHLAALAHRAWFTRIWTIQEVWQAQEIVVRVGNKDIEWTFVLHEIQRLWPKTWACPGMVLRTDGVPSAIINLYCRNVSVLSSVLHPGWSSAMSPAVRGSTKLPYASVFEIMCRTAKCKCVDPRDRLFALVSLFQGDLPPALKPDYSRSITDVYVGVTKYALETCPDRSDAILTKARGLRSSEHLLPTWVTDWTRVQQDWEEVDALVERAKSIRQCQRSLQRVHLSFIPNARLKVRGNRVGRIERVTENPRLRGGHSETHGFGDRYDMQISFVIEPEIILRSFVRNIHPCRLARLSASSKVFEVKARNKVRTGDYICVFFGFALPYVLRKFVGSWQPVGECWPDEWDSGEAPSAKSALIPVYMEQVQVMVECMRDACYAEDPAPFEDFEII